MLYVVKVTHLILAEEFTLESREQGGAKANLGQSSALKYLQIQPNPAPNIVNLTVYNHRRKKIDEL